MAKLYTKNTWADEVLAGDERYNILDDNGDPIESTVQIELATAVAQAGTAVDADKMNNIEDGIDAIDDRLDDLETGIDSGMVDYSDTSTITGWSSFSTKVILYKVIGKMVFVEFNIAGTSNNTAAQFTLPYARAGGEARLPAAVIADNGSYQSTPGVIRLTTNLVRVYKDATFTVFTASAGKTVIGQFWYEMA